MKGLILAFAIPLSILIASPTMAVHVVMRSDGPQRERLGYQAIAPSTTANQGTVQPQDPAKLPAERTNPSQQKKASPPPERRTIKGSDNFIDENHDGINDRLQKPPEVIRRREPRRDHPPDRAPQRAPERQRDREPVRDRRPDK